MARSSILFIENSQPFPRVLFSSLINGGEFKIDRAFSPVNAMNKMKERRYDFVLMCGGENGTRKLWDAVKATGASYLSIRLSPEIPKKDRQGVLQNVALVIEDLHHSAEFNLSGFKRENDLFGAASVHVIRYIREHLETKSQDSQNLQLYSILEGSRMGVAIFSGRKLQRVNHHLSELLGYAPEDINTLELPDLFLSQDDYREFSRTMTRNKNEAGWHCSPGTLATKTGPGIRCNLMVRRLDGFDPLKGHLLIVEKSQETEAGFQDLRQVMTRETTDSGSFEKIIAEVPGIIIVSDNEGIITHANASAQGVFGYLPGEMESQNLVGTIVPENSRYANQMIAMINDPVFCRDGYAIYAFEHAKKNGEKIWVAWKILALRDSSEKISGMLLLGEDITEYNAKKPGRIRADPWKYQVLRGTQVNEQVFDAVFHLCLEISREGREGHVVGTAFVIGDTLNVMEHSRACTINSFEGQPRQKRQIANPEIAEVIKGLAQMDGAFVIREDGFIEASGRHFIIDNLVLKIPEGYGTRHSSVAGITQMTNAIGFVVSTTGGKVSIMKDGEIKKGFVV
ncbi:MAG: PAS domain S-box protein [Methanoregula sp.]